MATNDIDTLTSPRRVSGKTPSGGSTGIAVDADGRILLSSTDDIASAQLEATQQNNFLLNPSKL